MKNYYEILEVDKNASEEIIEKAYKTLAKKYHPDLQNQSKSTINKENSNEEKMKKINEAYEILSNEFKRKAYDEQLQSSTISIEQYQKIMQENQKLKNQIQQISYASRNNIVQQTNNITQQANNVAQQINNAINQAYEDAYIQDMQNRGYKIKYKPTIKQWIKLIIAIILTIIAIALIIQIPFVKEFFIKIYNENKIIKLIVDVFKETFTRGL